MTKRAPTLSKFWPEGLTSLTVYFFPDAGTFGLASLVKELESRKLPYAEAGGSLSLRVNGAKGSKGFAARLLYSSSEQTPNQIEFDVRQRILSDVPTLDINELPVILGNAFSGDPEEPTFTFLYFVLKQERWRPAFPLPMTIPAFADGVGATPEIQGFEFAYPGVRSPLRRASISLGPGSARDLYINPMISVPLLPPETLLERVCSTAVQHLPAFATPTDG